MRFGKAAGSGHGRGSLTRREPLVSSDGAISPMRAIFASTGPRLEPKGRCDATILTAGALALLGGLLAAGLLGAQSRTDAVDAEAELIVAMPDDTQNMDPRLGMGSVRSTYIRQVFESLVDTDPQGRPVPGLALSWKPVGDTTWEWTLRPGRSLPQRRGVQRRHRALQPRPDVQEEPRQVGHQGRAHRGLRQGVSVRLALGKGQRPDGAHPHHRARADALGLHRPRAAGAQGLHDQERRRRPERAPGRHGAVEARRVEAQGLDASSSAGTGTGARRPRHGAFAFR